MGAEPSPHCKRARMDRYHVGDRVDCTDLEGLWHEAVVREVDPVQGYRVHFLGWSSRWDEWVEITSERIQPPYSKVRNWRPALRIGDPVEIRSATYPDRWLSGLVVAVDPHEGRVKCEYSNDSRGGCRWVDMEGEEICLPNTHFSRQLDSTSPPKVEQFHREGEVHSGARSGDVTAVARAIGQDPTSMRLKGPLERTPLLIASEACRVEVVRALICAGAPLSDVDRSNASCLHLAVRGPKERCPDVVRELAQRGANVNARDSRLSTPLHLVAMRGYPDVTMTLIRHGAHVNAQDMSGVTPLRHAAYRGEEAIVSILLRYGADPTIPDAVGGRPMDVACYLRNKDNRQAVESLLREGHVGYLLKKMRQVCVWESGYEVQEGGSRSRSEVVATRREHGHDIPTLRWTQLGGSEPPHVCVASAMARYVTAEMNGDLFTELVEYFV